MTCLAFRAGKDGVGHREQFTDFAAMKPLHEIVLVKHGPKGPDLVKHHYEQSLRFPLPIGQSFEQPCGISEAVEPIATVLDKDLAALFRQTCKQ
jgi:hypothetical protein